MNTQQTSRSRIVKTLILLASFCLIALFALPFISVDHGSPEAVAADTYRIGVSLGLTGEYAQPARVQKMAYRLWEREVNATGGLLGRPVSVIIVDDQSNMALARKTYEDLIEGRSVDCVFGPYSSKITQAVAPIADKWGYPMLAAGSASDSIWRQGYKHVLGMWAPASRYASGILDLAYSYSIKRIAIVYADDAFSIEVAEGAKKWAAPYQLDVVLFEKMKAGTNDLRPLAHRTKDAGVELLVLGGHFEESVAMRRALSHVGWDRNFFATVGPAMEKYGKVMGAEADLTFAASIWEPDSKFPGSREFAVAFKNTYQKEPSYHAATAYAAGQILKEAIELAGSLERERIRQAMFDLDTHSIIGRYAVDKTGIQIKSFPLTIQWQNGNKKIVWWEEEQSTKPIIK